MSDPSGQAGRLYRDCAVLPFELATDFVESARLLRDGVVSAAMVKVVPLRLTGQGDR